MYNADFYPTPAAVAAKMLERFDWKDLSKARILEPSAGKGDLADAIANKMSEYDRWGHTARQIIHCLEIDPELQAAVRGKGFTLVGTDFLEFWPDEKYTLIIMNPPFSNGDKHLLHAWEILDHGEIVCLLNSETLKNTFSQSRRLLAEIIAEHGEVEHLGSCFTDAFRKTDVSVSLVRLHKERQAAGFSFEAGPETDKAESFSGGHFGDEIATRDLVGNLVADYDRVREIFLELSEKIMELGYYASRFGIYKEDFTKTVENLVTSKPSRDLQESCYNDFVRKLKSRAWSTVFRLTKYNDLVSEGVRKELDNLLDDNRTMAFSRANITALLQTLLANRSNILHQCVVEAFDRMTKYYKENREVINGKAAEGWLTNDAWRVNRRVVLPAVIDSRWSKPEVNYERKRMLDDIDRGMAFLEGKSLEQVPARISKTLEVNFGEHRFDAIGAKIETTYFVVRAFKKGTIHLFFKDEELWKLFNLTAAKGKNWLPDTYKEDRKADRARNKYADKFGLPMPE